MANAIQKQNFINRVWNAIQTTGTGGLFPSVIIAQAALESGWGESLLAKQYNNYFGMKKGSGVNYGGWNGQTVTLKTGEVFNGQPCTINGVFRRYASIEESIIDHNGLLCKLSRYKPCLSASTPEEQIIAIKNGGYATATSYVQSVMSVINSNDLTRFDSTSPTPGTQGNTTTTTTQTFSSKKKVYKMNTRTLSIIILAAGLALAAVGGYNLIA